MPKVRLSWWSRAKACLRRTSPLSKTPRDSRTNSILEQPAPFLIFSRRFLTYDGRSTTGISYRSKIHRHTGSCSNISKIRLLSKLGLSPMYPRHQLPGYTRGAWLTREDHSSTRKANSPSGAPLEAEGTVYTYKEAGQVVAPVGLTSYSKEPSSWTKTHHALFKCQPTHESC